MKTFFPLLLALVFFLLSSACFADQAGDFAHPMPAREAGMYRQLAHRIFIRIEGLKSRYPHLVSIENETHKEEAADKLWVAYHYTHGMHWVPNPDYRPAAKGGTRVKSFSPRDGIELDLYFYEGAWNGQAAVLPFGIGAMNAVTFIEGGDTAAVAALRGDITRILSEEKAAFRIP